MAGELVFITGGSGHIGFRVIVDALEAGYQVRAAVRSLEKGDKILSTPSIKRLNPGGRLAFVQVPDLTADGAYEEAIKGAEYVIHVASPIVSSYGEGTDLAEHFIQPSLNGTTNILKAAQKAGSVRRVVITSSMVAIIPWNELTSGKCNTVFTETNRIPTPTEYKSPFEAYAAGKTAALNEAEKWIENVNPSFDLVHVFPGFVIGGNELITDPKDALYGANRQVLCPVTGVDAGFVPGASVHLNDVSAAHVLALDPKITGNQGFVLASGGLEGTKWEDTKEITARHFKKEVESGVLRNNGKITTLPVKIDERKTEEVLGLSLLPFEAQVTHVVSHYLGLIKAKH
ncbi:hypothetical protein N7510_005039 [Penicillium lagena]|uniref:uncharacterized protein n=1 Tax=Penicillium lagena TaxID=94218 RepID=UPI002540CCD9|nr:uncharacterized protein N7510_005039 [Penicillium lagena]KAJ5621055.1 hypothetical protein N7510_005039 [Penicillium lagena]